MPRISAHSTTLLVQRNLDRVTRQLQANMERLSTGLRVNRASDDPAAMVAGEQLANTTGAMTPAINSAQQASTMVAIADTALGQISNLLLSIQQLVLTSANSAGLSQQQRAANQVQIDNAVASIDRLASTTSFAGQNLLDGSLGYSVSGADPMAIAQVRVDQVRLGLANPQTVQVSVAAQAQHAALQFRASQCGLASIRITGPGGSQAVSLASALPASAIVATINLSADSTGVSASLINPLHPASGVQLTSRDLGSRAFVSVQPLDGTFTTTDLAGHSTARGQGADAVGTINGSTARGDGQTLSLASDSLGLTVDLADGFAGDTTFSVGGHGANFTIGPELARDVASLALPSVRSTQLGSPATGFLSQITTGGSSAVNAGQAESADAIVAAAIAQVADVRGRLGSLTSTTLDTSINSLNQQLDQIAAARSAAVDTNVAAETSALARNQLLQQMIIGVMASANTASQNALQLLLTYG